MSSYPGKVSGIFSTLFFIFLGSTWSISPFQNRCAEYSDAALPVLLYLSHQLGQLKWVKWLLIAVRALKTPIFCRCQLIAITQTVLGSLAFTCAALTSGSAIAFFCCPANTGPGCAILSAKTAARIILQFKSSQLGFQNKNARKIYAGSGKLTLLPTRWTSLGYGAAAPHCSQNNPYSAHQYDTRI